MESMSSRERMLAAIRGQSPDHMPLYAWVFGFKAPPDLRWETDGRPVEYWYTQRMEHLHTLPQAWDLAQDFRRVDAWLSLGVDDVLDVSIPWSQSEQVARRDMRVLPGQSIGGITSEHPLFAREYQTPDGALVHIVKQTGEEQAPGWVIQPDGVPLFEDFNIPRAARHVVSGPEDVAKVKWLYQSPGADGRAWLDARMQQVTPFARERGVLTQAWSAFGVDALVWLAGVENAVTLAMDDPDAFDELLTIIHQADVGRTALALEHEVDMVVERGWYSSIDFWSPRIFKRHFKPRIAELAQMAHARGRLFGYVMTTGVTTLGAELMDAGVDLLYYADPAQDRVDLAWAKRAFGGKMAVAGGINTSLTLTPNNPGDIRAAVRAAMDCYSGSGGFILSPVDALFPDTPWPAVQTMIDAWRENI
jgi:hypothetical protein